MSSYERIIYEVKDGVSWIILNRPEKLNALDDKAWSELTDAIYKADKDDNVYCIVITGSGRAFSAGDDISVMESLKDHDDAERFYIRGIGETVKALIYCSKPVIMAVNGLAYGGGMELLLLADIVIASNKARFSIPEARIGVLPLLMPTLGVLVLGLRRVSWLSMTCEVLSAEEAKSIGLVDYVVPHEKLEDEVKNVCEKLKDIPRQSLRSIRRILSYWRTLGLQPVGISELVRLTLTDEAKRRMRAFLKK